MKKALMFVAVILLLGGCVSKHDISLVGFNSEEILRGVFDESNSTVTVVMPNGEVLIGGYSSLDGDEPVNISNTFGYSSGGAFGGVGLGLNFGYESVKYALLTSQASTLKMEIFLTIRSWSKNGFGEAKTNDGRVYKIQF